MCQSVLSTLTGFCFNTLEQRGGGAGVSVGAVDSDRLLFQHFRTERRRCWCVSQCCRL